MRKLFLVLAVITSGYSVQSQADTLQIPINQQGSQVNINLPQFGDSQQQVLSLHGEPVKRYPSVGQPPITRWDYADFSVYFEYKTVINSVKHHQPKVAQ